MIKIKKKKKKKKKKVQHKKLLVFNPKENIQDYL
jgi:hypothetical protein